MVGRSNLAMLAIGRRYRCVIAGIGITLLPEMTVSRELTAGNGSHEGWLCFAIRFACHNSPFTRFQTTDIIKIGRRSLCDQHSQWIWTLGTVIKRYNHYPEGATYYSVGYRWNVQKRRSGTDGFALYFILLVKFHLLRC